MIIISLDVFMSQEQTELNHYSVHNHVSCPFPVKSILCASSLFTFFFFFFYWLTESIRWVSERREEMLRYKNTSTWVEDGGFGDSE